MSSKFPEYIIDDLKADSKNAIAMGPFGSRIKAENFKTNGVPIIKGQNLNGDFLLEQNYDYLTTEKADELRASNAFRRDIVITHRGTIGQVGIIPGNSRYKRYVVSQSQLKISIDENKVNPYFLYYFLRSPEGQHRLLLNASQVGVPAIARASSSVRKISVPCPPLEKQNLIVKILYDFDQKIEKNNQINETLEAMAQAIFKSWFIDFDPVKAKMKAKEQGLDADGVNLAAMRIISSKTDSELEAMKQASPEDYKNLENIASHFPEELVESELGMIPKGWEVKAIQKIAFSQGGFAFKSKDFILSGDSVIKIKNINDDGTVDVFNTDFISRELSSKTSKFRLNDHDLIMAMTGATVGKFGIVNTFGKNVFLNQRVARFTSNTKGRRVSNYLYCFFNNEAMKSYIFGIAQGSAQPNISSSQLDNIPLLFSSEWLIDAFINITDNIFFKRLKNISENKSLTELRDSLLPKLLSGEIEV